MRQKWLIAALLLGGLASAQDSPLGGLFQGQQQTIGGALGNLFSSTPAPAQTAPSGLQYRRSAAVSARVQKNFADTLVRAGNLTGDRERQFRQAVAQSLTPANLEQVTAQLFPREGFKTTDLSDASAMFLVACFGVVQDLGQTTVQQNLGVRDQLRNAYLKTPGVLELTDAQKQTLAETMLYYMVFMLNDYVQAKQGAQGYTLGAAQGNASNVLKALGLDPDALRLGQKGLERKAN